MQKVQSQDDYAPDAIDNISSIEIGEAGLSDEESKVMMQDGTLLYLMGLSKEGKPLYGKEEDGVKYTLEDIQALPDIKLITKAGKAVIDSFPYMESFENGLGDWGQVATDSIDWTLYKGYTPSTYTGPSGASDGRYYLYVEATNPNFPEEMASLEADFDFSSIIGPAMTFDYHMYGANMGTLVVDVFDGSVWHYDYWKITGQQQTSELDTFKQAFVDLSDFGGNASVKIRISGITGNEYASDICIDNIVVQLEDVLTYVSNATTQNTDNTYRGASYQDIIGIQVTVSGMLDTLKMKQFTFNTNGSTNTSTDISNIELYYTGNVDTFYKAQKFGSTVFLPPDTFNIVDSILLQPGTNYFWLVYFIPLSAAAEDSLDAQCVQMIVGDSVITPIIIDPTGQRVIAPSGDLTISSTLINLSSTTCDDIDTAQVTLSNVGTGDLDFSLSSVGDWIAFSLNSGTIPPGGDEIIDIYFNASGLPAGINTANIDVISNDPDNPKQIITTNYTINGSPVIGLSDTGIPYDTVSTDWPMTKNIVIYNTGCDALTITDISSTIPEFIIKDTAHVIPPFDSVVVGITFAPLTLTSFNNVIIILNDDVDTTISVSGYGGEPPVMLMNSAKEINHTLSCKHPDTTSYITIENNGGSLLDVLFTSDQKQITTPYSGTSSYPGNMLDLSTNENIIIKALDIHCSSASFAYTIEVYYKEGSFAGYETDPSAWTLASTRSFTSATSTGLTYVDIDDIHLSQGDYALYITATTGGNLSYTYGTNTSTDGTITIYTGTGNPYPFGSALPTRYWHGTIYYTEYITSDLISAGTSETYELEFSAEGMSSGNYSNNFIIYSNDLLNTSDTIACSLKVVNEPEIFFRDTVIDLGEALVGQTSNDVFVFGNTGCDILYTKGYDCTSPAFSLEPDIEVPPYDSLLLAVYFSPDAPGQYIDTITFYTIVGDTAIIVKGLGVASIIDSVTTTTEDGAYNRASVIDLYVHYSSAVDVDTTGGNIPRIALNTYDSTGYAYYYSGSGTDTLVFKYIVDNNENSEDLDFDSTHTIILEGATILAGGELAGLILPEVGEFSYKHDIIIDSERPRPTLSMVGSSPVSDYPIEVTITFDEEVTGLSMSDLDIVNGTTSNLSTVVSRMQFTVDLTPETNGEVTVDLPSGKVQDMAGNSNRPAFQLSFDFNGYDEIKEAGVILARIYPNPNNGKFWIEFNDVQFMGQSISIVDITGRTVAVVRVLQLVQEIDMSSHTQGVYLMKMVLGDKAYNYKFVIQ